MPNDDKSEDSFVVLDSAVDRTNVFDETEVQPLENMETDSGTPMISGPMPSDGVTDFCDKIIVLDSKNSQNAPLADGMY